MAKIPKKLQPVFWSTPLAMLDLLKDRDYIIHQIFQYGRLEHIQWLFKTYTEEEIIKSFKKYSKDYSRSRFYLIKDTLLGLNNWHPDERYYVKNIPRAIG